MTFCLKTGINRHYPVLRHWFERHAMRLPILLSLLMACTSLPALTYAADISAIPDYIGVNTTTPSQQVSSYSLQQKLDAARAEVPSVSKDFISSGKQVISKETLRMQQTASAKPVGASTGSTVRNTPVAPPKFTEIEIRKTAASQFQPRASAGTGDWSTKVVDSKSKKAKDKFCLMENSFKNNYRLMIAQRADGSSTLGINYGLDILQDNKDYAVQVQIDDSFDVTFDAYAQSPETLIIQMGQKSSFFSALSKAEALHIAMAGMASTFSLAGMETGIQEFSQCLQDIGSPELISDAPAMPAMEIPPVVSETIAEASAEPEVEAPALPLPVPVKPQPVTQSWAQQAMGLMARYGIIPETVQETADGLSWTSENGNLRSTAKYVESSDIIDTSFDMLDKAEQSCDGEFSSQMGLPEGEGENATQSMESKCVKGDVISISTWLLQQKGKAVIAWIMEASRTQKDLAFNARDKLISAIKQP
jgi:hypothetical protein